MRSAARFAALWFAAWCQVVAVAMPAGMLAVAFDPFGAVPICHADGAPAPPAQPAHSDHDCLLCAICHLHSGPVALLSPEAVFLHLPVLAVLRFGGPLPRAPPPSMTIAAQPRGPPSLI